MPRSNRPRRSGRPATGTGASSYDGLDVDRALAGTGRLESHPDGEWRVRPVTGAAATKTYRCPGCDQEIRAGVPHVVAWPEAALADVTDRRHWHTPCWSARTRRTARSPRRPR